MLPDVRARFASTSAADVDSQIASVVFHSGNLIYKKFRFFRFYCVFISILDDGTRLNGAPNDPDMPSTPPLVRAPFLRNWDGKTVATLFEYTRATMPQNNPGYMTDQQYIDIIAFMLSSSNIPAGQEELSADPEALSGITIEAQR